MDLFGRLGLEMEGCFEDGVAEHSQLSCCKLHLSICNNQLRHPMKIVDCRDLLRIASSLEVIAFRFRSRNFHGFGCSGLF